MTMARFHGLVSSDDTYRYQCARMLVGSVTLDALQKIAQEVQVSDAHVLLRLIVEQVVIPVSHQVEPLGLEELFSVVIKWSEGQKKLAAMTLMRVILTESRLPEEQRSQLDRGCEWLCKRLLEGSPAFEDMSHDAVTTLLEKASQELPDVMSRSEWRESGERAEDAVEDTLPDLGSAFAPVVESLHKLVRGKLVLKQIPGMYTIGRSTSSDLMLRSPNVAWNHARIERRDDGIFLCDEGSPNGTSVNGELLTSQRANRPLHHGDVVVVGAIELLFSDPASDDAERLAPALTAVDDPNNTMWKLINFRQKYTAGRALDCDFVLPDASAHRNHAVIERRVNGVYIDDRGNENGVKVNGSYIPSGEEHRLYHGDELTLGVTRLLFSHPGWEDVSAALPAPALEPPLRRPFWLIVRHTKPESPMTPYAEAVELPSMPMERVCIGRAPLSEVHLDDISVSGEHAVISWNGSRYVITDRGSLNGTWVDEVRLPPHEPHFLSSSTTIRVGFYELFFYCPNEPIEAGQALLQYHISNVRGGALYPGGEEEFDGDVSQGTELELPSFDIPKGREAPDAAAPSRAKGSAPEAPSMGFAPPEERRADSSSVGFQGPQAPPAPSVPAPQAAQPSMPPPSPMPPAPMPPPVGAPSGPDTAVEMPAHPVPRPTKEQEEARDVDVTPVATQRVRDFERWLSDGAGRPGPMERLVAQSRGLMNAMHKTLSLRFVPMVAACDALLEMVTEYVHRIYRTWKALYTAGRKWQRQRDGTLALGLGDDLLRSRLQLARTLRLSGFLFEKEQLKRGDGTTKEVFAEPVVLLEQILALRGHLDQMKRDVDALPSFGQQISRTWWKQLKQAVMSLIPNPFAFLVSWKDLLVMHFAMRYNRKEVQQSYENFVWHMLQLVLDEQKKAEAEHVVDVPALLISRDGWEGRETDFPEIQMDGGAGPMVDVSVAMVQTQTELARLLWMLCFPARFVEPTRWSTSDLLYELDVAERTQIPHTRAFGELMQRLRKYAAEALPAPSKEERNKRKEEQRMYRMKRKIVKKLERTLGVWH